MRSHSSVLVVALVVACGGEARDVEGHASEVVPPIEVAPAPEVAIPSLYDDEGNLRESDEQVAGLTLPMGLTPNAGDEERLHTYLSDVPIAAILRYFGPRLTTGQVEARPGGGASYRAAVPREVTAGAVRMDVTIMPVPGSRTLVEIREIPPEPVTPPSEAESIRSLTETLRTAE